MCPISSPCGEREKYLPSPAAARGEIDETLCEACCRVVDWFSSCPACRRSSPECFLSRRSRSLEAASSIAGRSSSARDSRTIRAPAYRVMICEQVGYSHKRADLRLATVLRLTLCIRKRTP